MELLSHINFQVWMLLTLAMMITALLLPGLTVSGPLGALIAVVGLAFVNAHYWDTALFFSIPQAFSLDAVILLVSNGVIFWILVKLLPGIEIRGFLPALLAPIIFTVTSSLLNTYAKDVDWIKLLKTSLAYVESAKDELKDLSQKGPPGEKSPRPAQ